jgi:hypothetical protein
MTWSGIAERETTLPDRSRLTGRVGLIAGEGYFPVRFAEAARRQGVEVVCCGLIDHADPQLEGLCDGFFWCGVGKLGGMIRGFRRRGVDTVVMAGKVHKHLLFDKWRVLRHLPDWRTVKFVLDGRRHEQDQRDDTILLRVVAEFERDGLRMASALEICPELLVQPGTLTARAPSAADLRDIAFGWQLAREMGRLDVGQSVCVRESAVLAVEAIEGTDEAIRRAGALCPGGGFTVVKVAKPEQDMRFDVPTVGTRTVETIRQAGGRTLAIEAGRTILIDGEQTIRRANEIGLCVAAFTEDSLTAQIGAA